MPPGGRIRVELQANSASCCDHQQRGKVKHNSPGMHSNIIITAAVVISIHAVTEVIPITGYTKAYLPLNL